MRRARWLRPPAHLVLPVLLLGGIFFAFGWAPAAAEEPASDLGDVSDNILFQEIGTVYAASKYGQKTTEAPAFVSIITAEEIKRFRYRTVGDILASAVGFYNSYDRIYNNIGVRGFSLPGDYSTRILVQLNGHRLNENIYNSMGLGMDGIIDVDLIDRVEIIRGPGSSLYGSNAFFAVVNIISKRGRNYKTAEISGEAGSYETYKGRATYGDRYEKGAELLLSGTYFSSQGKNRLYYREFDDPATNNGYAERADDTRARSFFASVEFGDFTLDGAYSKRDKGIPGAPYETVFNANDTELYDERGYLDLKYEKQFSKDFGAMLRLFYDGYQYEGTYIYESGLDDPPLTKNRDSATGQWVGGELHVTKQLFDSHRLVTGGELRQNFQQDQKTYDQEPYESYLDQKSDSTIWALFVQDEFRPWDHLAIYAGLRYDHYSTFGGALNPRAALVYSPLKETTLKLLYGRAFRAPNDFELYYGDGGNTSKPNPDLDPETIDHFEAVIEQYFWKYFRGTLSAYYYHINDLITEVLDPEDELTNFTNLAEVEAKGLEFELEFFHQQYDLRARAGVSIQDTDDKEAGNDLVNSPTYLAKFNVIFPIFRDKIYAGPEMNYVGQRRTVQGGHAGDALVAGLTLSTAKKLVPFLPNLELSASCFNLFDEDYGDPASNTFRQDTIPQDGRTFLFKATYSF
jgi:iron complex outermembrane receptor protein